MSKLLECLVAVREQFGKRVVVSTHPRTRKRLEALNSDLDLSGIDFMEPFGFHDYNKLQLEAACVLSDSGTISEESSILGFPAITLRDSIERPEALDSGSIIMTGLNSKDVVTALGLLGSLPAPQAPSAYEIRDTSARVVRFIVSTANRHAGWAALHSS